MSESQSQGRALDRLAAFCDRLRSDAKTKIKRSAEARTLIDRWDELVAPTIVDAVKKFDDERRSPTPPTIEYAEGYAAALREVRERLQKTRNDLEIVVIGEAAIAAYNLETGVELDRILIALSAEHPEPVDDGKEAPE